MQKLAKRAAQAQRQASRRTKQQWSRDSIEHETRTRIGKREAVAEVRQNLKDARIARREDWELGPLAPKRDLGFNNYGVYSSQTRGDWSNSGTHQPHPRVLEKRCAWAGGVKQLNLAPGDRVVIQDGPDTGKIDRIRTVQPQTGTVTLEKCHQALTMGMLDNPSRVQAMPLSIGSIRLVYPITNPETGITKDTIINQLKPVPPNMQSPNMSLDRWQYGKKWDRLVPGLNVVIPWPEVEVPQFETMAADTVRQQVEDRTFYYSLLSPPMPESVVDELRNKFSRFRTRHEASYIQKKEAEAAEKKARQEAFQSMQTPLDEFHERQRKLREERGELELSDDMLEKIGEFMSKKKTATLDNAGVSEVLAASSTKQPGDDTTSPAAGPQ